VKSLVEIYLKDLRRRRKKARKKIMTTLTLLETAELAKKRFDELEKQELEKKLREVGK